MHALFNDHQKIALQVSGGRDSIACLYLMRPFWPRLTVYWVNTGAAFPETVQIMAQVRAMVPHFVEIDGRQPDVVAEHGMPSDLVPASRTPIGAVVEGSTELIQDRYSCCARVMMAPMHQRMIEDGITLIIRGQKDADQLKAPIRSGHIENGIEYLFPIQDWSAAGVMSYLRQQDAPIARFYEMLDGAPDCMTCTAYWEHGAAAYLKRYHYPHFVIVQERLQKINMAIGQHIVNFNKEVNAWA